MAKDLEAVAARIAEAVPMDPKAHTVVILSSAPSFINDLKNQMSGLSIIPNAADEMLIRGAFRQISASILHAFMEKKGITSTVIDASRIASGLENKKKIRFRRLALNAIKKRILKNTYSIVYINRAVKVQAAGLLRYLNSDFFSISLAASLGIRSCSFFMDTKHAEKAFSKISVQRKELSLSYLEATEIADLIHDKGITKELIRYARQRRVGLEIINIYSGKKILGIFPNRAVSRDTVRLIRPVTHLAKIHLEWEPETEYEPALILSNLAKANITIYHLHYAHLTKPKNEMSFFIDKSNLEDFSMIMEYHQKDLGCARYIKDSNLGILELIGERMENTALMSMIVSKILRNENLEFAFLESRPGKLSISLGGDDLKTAHGRLMEEFAREIEK